MKKITSFIMIIMIFFCINSSKVYADNRAITLNRNNVTIGINYSIKLIVNSNYSFNRDDVSWFSNNEGVATVDNGTVTGHNEGVAIITAILNNYRATCVVNVSKNYVKIAKISLDNSSDEITLNQTKKINVNIEPSNATDKRLTYISSNPSIVSVDSSGNITGVSLGTTIITIASSTNDIKASLLVKVIDRIGLKGIKINESITINEKASSRLSISFNPNNATNQKVTWKSSNPNVITVDQTGVIYGVSPGSATVQAISNENGYVSSCRVTVNALSKDLKKLTLNKHEITLNIDDEETLSVNFEPSYAEDKNVKWESSDKKIATVEDGKIKALKIGTTTIKVINEKTKLEDTCTVTVLSKPIKSISFEKENQTIYLGNQLSLKTISDPIDSSINNPIWSSSDESIVTVENGVITAKKIGIATITISNEDGTISATTNVQVIEKPADTTTLMIKVKGYELNFDPKIKNYTLKIGDESSLTFDLNISKKKYTINGNKGLKNGSIITITLNDQEQTQYVIYIKKKESNTILFIGIISVLLLLNIIRMLIKNKNKNKN